MNSPPIKNLAQETTTQLFLSRKDLCTRWSVSIDFLRTLEETGKLVPKRFGSRCLRYRLSDIIEYESN